MYRFAFFVALAFTALPCLAQIQATPRVPQKVTDPIMVIDDRGTKLEVLPAKRASQKMSRSEKQIVHRVFAADSSAPISQQQLGVVFNHAMQVQGYITGEIVFKMKNNREPDGFDPTLYPGLAKLTNPNVYLVVARTPTEFVEMVKRLQGRGDLEWVEPIVSYGALQPAGTRLR